MIFSVIGNSSVVDYQTIQQNVIEFLAKNGLKCNKIITGNSKGVESKAIEYAINNKISYSIVDIDKKGSLEHKILRNISIIEKSDCVLIFWNKKDKIIQDTILYCINNKKRYHLFRV